MNTAGPNPTSPGNADLDAVFRGALRAEFRVFPARSETPSVLLTVAELELASLREVLRLSPGPGPHCMCAGDMELVVIGRQQATITLHHGYTIRWPGPWDWSDAALADPDAFIGWLAARGVTRYADENAQRRDAALQRERQRERWLAAAPQYLRDWLPALEETSTGMPRRLNEEDVNECLAVLRATIGNDDEIAVALLRWFGSGAGPWSGFPCYEDVPEALLVGLGTRQVLSSVASRPIDEPTLGGLARYFGSHEHRKKRRVDLRTVPAELRDRMVALLVRQGDEGNVERLRSAIRAAEQAMAQKAKAKGAGPTVVTVAERPAAKVPATAPAPHAALALPELVQPRAPDETTGDRRLAAIDCGNYGEDQLVAWRVNASADEPEGVVLTLRSGSRWRVESNSTLHVEGEGWKAKNFAAIRTELFLTSGHKRAVTHFEIDIMWGGVHPDEVAAFVREVAAAAACALSIEPTRRREPEGTPP
jgi:hypothetical protein